MRSSYRDAGRLWFTHRVLYAIPAPEPPGYDRPHRATKNHSAANERNIKHLQSDMDCGSQRLKRWESLPYWAFLGKGGVGGVQIKQPFTKLSASLKY